MEKYASGEEPKVGDLVRYVEIDELEGLISYGEVLTVKQLDFAINCLCADDEKACKQWISINHFELVRRSNEDQKELNPQVGWWRQRDGAVALASYYDADESEMISGVANYNKDDSYPESWEKNGKSQIDEERPADLIEFLAPLTLPDFPAPDIINGPGTYELEEEGKAVVLWQDCNGDWIVAIEYDVIKLHTYTRKGKELEAVFQDIVKKISNQIEL